MEVQELGKGSATRDNGPAAVDPHEFRLMALLKDLVQQNGLRETARILGVDRRTVAASIDGGKLSRRTRGALEVALLAGADSEEAKRRERLAALETKVAEFEQLARAGQLKNRRAIEEGLTGLREDHSRALQHIEKRLEALEAVLLDLRTLKPTANTKVKPTVTPPARQYPEIVTWEPEPGEEQVYGDAAPLIVEWRDVRTQVLASGRSRSKRRAEERFRELEIALIREHGLTLPPARHPWDSYQRRDELDRRLRVMEAGKAKGLLHIVRKWLRRVLAMGLLATSA